jgi:hypothetical protein
LSWRDELVRYEALSLPRYGASLRRASVALMLLLLVASVFRTRRAGGRNLSLATRALAIGLALLVFTPSKWAWHFGTLLPLAAVAAAAEAARLRDEASSGGRTRALPVVWIAGAVVVAAWSWTPRLPWDWFDLRTLGWTLGVESLLPVAKFVVFLPLLVLLGAVVVGVVRDGRARPLRAAWGVAAWSAR